MKTKLFIIALVLICFSSFSQIIGKQKIKEINFQNSSLQEIEIQNLSDWDLEFTFKIEKTGKKLFSVVRFGFFLEETFKAMHLLIIFDGGHLFLLQ